MFFFFLRLSQLLPTFEKWMNVLKSFQSFSILHPNLFFSSFSLKMTIIWSIVWHCFNLSVYQNRKKNSVINASLRKILKCIKFAQSFTKRDWVIFCWPTFESVWNKKCVEVFFALLGNVRKLYSFTFCKRLLIQSRWNLKKFVNPCFAAIKEKRASRW